MRRKRASGAGNGRTSSLAQVDVLEPLSEDELEGLAARCLNIHLESGEEYACPEEYAGGLLLVMEGRVQVYRLTSSGRQFTFSWLGGGKSFLIWGSQELHIHAVAPSTVALVRLETLQAVVRKKPEVAGRVVGMLFQ